MANLVSIVTQNRVSEEASRAKNQEEHELSKLTDNRRSIKS